MPEWVLHIIFPVARWLHMVSMTLIVGGTLFYELVVPKAIEDLKEEQQLYVFARARWVFRWVVWLSVTLLLITGSIGLWQNWNGYHNPYLYPQAKPWAMAHVTVGLVALLLALWLTLGPKVPEHPIRWMRLNLVVLLVLIFLADASRHMRLTIRARREAAATQPALVMPAAPPPTTNVSSAR